MSALHLPARVLALVHRHAERVWPEECCGILVGRAGGGSAVVVVERAIAAANVAADRARRYEIAPEVLLAVHKEARGEGRAVVGYYHSHPRPPAWPSPRDLDYAWPETSYLIVALDQGRAVETRSFRLAAGGRGFEPEDLKTLSETTSDPPETPP